VLVNDIGSILEGREACDVGLIDCVGGIKDALEYLKERCKKNNQS
jgi:ATP-dependent protease ClpP protease subunit